MDLADLTLGHFEPLVGGAFRISDPVPVGLVLAEATSAGEWPGGREPFRLHFRGPREPLLEQSIYRLEHDELGALEIFIVPTRRDAESTTYEAIFT
jgi:hypothetical protein